MCIHPLLLALYGLLCAPVEAKQTSLALADDRTGLTVSFPVY